MDTCRPRLRGAVERDRQMGEADKAQGHVGKKHAPIIPTQHRRLLRGWQGE